MNQTHFNWRRNTLLVVGLGLISLMHLPQVANAQANLREALQVSATLSWGDIIKGLSPQRRSGGSRDGSVCILSMSQLPNVQNRVASLHPTLIWKGYAKSIGLRRRGETKPFWSRSLVMPRDAVQRIRYSSIPLMPGEQYSWVVYGGPNGERETIADFQVLSAAERAALNQQLQALDDANADNLRQQAELYRQAGVSADSLALLFQARNSSAELRQELAQIPDRWCPTIASR